MKKDTSDVIKRIASGVALALLTTIAVMAFLGPGGAFEGRAVSLRTDEPVTTTTIDTAAVLERPEPVASTTTTTTTTAPSASATKLTVPLVYGHYDCPGPGLDCTLTPGDDPGPNPDESDMPEKTIAAGDADYRAHLGAELCVVSVTWCDVDSSGHYIDKDATR